MTRRKSPGQSIGKTRDKAEYVSGYSKSGSVRHETFTGPGNRAGDADELVAERVEEMRRRYWSGLNLWTGEQNDV